MSHAGGVQTSEDPFRQAIDLIPALSWSTRPDGTADFFNRVWLDYTGLTAEQAVDWAGRSRFIRTISTGWGCTGDPPWRPAKRVRSKHACDVSMETIAGSCSGKALSRRVGKRYQMVRDEYRYRKIESALKKLFVKVNGSFVNSSRRFPRSFGAGLPRATSIT
jgi:PAS domain-containing protein